MVSSVANNTNTTSTTPNKLNDLSSEEFLKIIFTELQKQDPLQPNDSSKLLEQLSSIRSIQSDIELSDRLKTLVTENQLSSAGALIGTLVTGLDDTNQRIVGQVVSVSRTKDGPILNLSNGRRLSLSRVDEMALPPVSNPNNGGTNGSGTTNGTGSTSGSGTTSGSGSTTT